MHTNEPLNTYIDRLVNDTLSMHTRPKEETILYFIEKIKVLESLLVGNTIYWLFDHSIFYQIYISKNVEHIGYNSEQLTKGGLLLFFKIINKKQLFTVTRIAKWGRKFLKAIGYENVIKGISYTCGLSIYDKWGNLRVYMLKQIPLSTDENGEISLSLFEVTEITPIYKSNIVWYRGTCTTKDREITRAYFSNNPSKEYNDILSTREKEILQLAAKQKNNQEICEILDISKNTVERHRKNMISKVGVTDMTALIHIGQMMKII